MIKYLRVGKISKPHGLKSEFKVNISTDNLKRFETINKIYIIKNNQYNDLLASPEFYSFEIEYVKYLNDIPILKLKNFDKVEDIKKYINYDIYVDRDDLEPLKENEYYIPDLIGLKCISDENAELGKVIDVQIIGSNTNLIIKNNNKEFQIPMAKEYIKNIDFENGTIIIHLIEGILDI